MSENRREHDSQETLAFLTLPQAIEEMQLAEATLTACPECGSSDCTGCESGDGSDPCDDPYN